MNNVIRFAHPRWARRKMRAQASAWLARLDAGPSELDKQVLGGWLNEDPEHLQVLLEMAEFWDEMSVIEELSTAFPLKQYGSSARDGRLRRIPLLATAATLLLGLLSLAIIMRDGFVEEEARAVTLARAIPQTYETIVGERATYTLGDGSQIILNTNTLVEVGYGSDARNVHLLRGEAHFIVAKDASRPFRVHAGKGVIEALGTAFAVQRTGQNSLEVTVTEGRVNLSQTSAPVVATREAAIPEASAPTIESPLELFAGEYAMVNEESGEIEKEVIPPVEIEARLAWRNGMLLFQNDPLDQVLQEVSRYTATRIEADASIRDIPVYGYISTGDVEQLMTLLQDSFNIQVRKLSADHIVLTAK